MKKNNGRFFVMIAVVIISFLYFRNKQMIPPDSNPEIELISVDYKKDGVYDTLDLSKNEISKDLNDRLVLILKHVKIRNKLLPAAESYTVSDGDTHITIKVSLENSSLFVNLLNDSQFSSAQYHDRYYHIVNSENVYNEIYRLLAKNRCGF